MTTHAPIAGAPPVRYRGRFAPSPTGPLHFGSLVAALASWLEARSRAGEWLLRVEDIDPPREVPGASDAIVRALEALGLHWDGPVIYQSSRLESYREALRSLERAGATYGCGCSRSEIEAGVYPGTCRNGLPPGRQVRSIRVRVPVATIGFSDRVQGRFEQALATEVGDFVVKRADGLFAYHLAVVADDRAQGITDVVRGVDLLDSTPRHIHLQHLLGAPTPTYAHVPVAVNRDGQKLSKQTGAPALDPREAAPTLARALRFLGHPPPPEVTRAEPDEILRWASARWRMDDVPATRTVA